MNQKKSLRIKIQLISMICLLLASLACEQRLVSDGLEKIRQRGELVLITRNNSACFYEGPGGPAGFEYELASRFADHLNVKLRTVIIEDEAKMVEALLEEKGDILAPGTPFGAASSRFVALGPGYHDIQQQVVGRRDDNVFRELKDIQGAGIWVTPGSARMETLRRAKQSYPNLSWMVISDYSSEDLLRLVWNRSLPLTVVESTAMTMNNRLYPELIVHGNLGRTQKLTWAMHPQNRQLRRAVYRWFARTETKAELAGLVEHYYRHLEEFDYVDIVTFHSRLRDRLPLYREHFKAAANPLGLDWRLIAAQSYQESHWNPRAKSPTGVRGMMMLTLETARLMGLRNRLDAKDSIYAGTRFLAGLHATIGDKVAEPDRTLMALAAYNMGLGHLQDARSLAQRLKHSNNSWRDIRAVLPFLQQKKYYQNLTFGYARGEEAVQYVDRIRTYHKILTADTSNDIENFSASNNTSEIPQ